MISIEASNQLKGIGILTVIGLHLLPHLGGILPFWVVASLDQLGRFSVPLFLVLSGYGIAHKYSAPKYSQILSQTLKLLPSFLCWSLLIAWWVRPDGVWSEQVVPWTFLPTLVAGKFDYHLYFVPVLIVCYWLAPLLLRWLRAYPTTILILTGGLTLLGLAWVESLLFGSHVSILGYDQIIYTIPFVWVWYFVLGAWVAKHRAPSVAWWQVGVVTVLLLSEGFVSYLSLDNANQAFRFTRVGVWFYASVVSLWLLQVAAIRPHRGWLSELGKQSYQLYLGHTLAIRLVLSLFSGTISASTGLWVALSMGACWVISAKLTQGVAKKLSFNHQK